MKTVRLRLGTALLLCGVGLGACGGGAGQGHGVVRGLDPDRAQVTIEHGDIRGVMKAMTMTFAVDDPLLLEGIHVGQDVSFRVEYAGGRYAVTAIESH